jgi:hypothetical protein
MRWGPECSSRSRESPGVGSRAERLQVHSLLPFPVFSSALCFLQSGEEGGHFSLELGQVVGVGVGEGMMGG